MNCEHLSNQSLVVLRFTSQVGSEEQEYLDVITRNAKRLRQLTENILDATRIDGHSLKLNKVRLNLNDILVNCINDIKIDKYFNENEEEKLKIRYQPEDVLVEADRTRVHSSCFNLLSNARKFTKEGSISISSGLDANNNQAVISIKDTGKGIDPDILPRLFTRFASKSFQGTGLGLFISKSIVEAHGGRIWAENNPDGKGVNVFI